MAKPTPPSAATSAGPAIVQLRYIGPPATESPRYGALEPGRVYPESDESFAAYLLAQHPDHWTRADEPAA